MSGRKGYDRSRILAAATKARRRRRRKKAIALYRQVLEVEPNNTDVQRRVAPLLAQTRKPREAWAMYRRVLEQLVRQGFVERAIGVCREALGHLPRQVEAWTGLAELECRRERPADAVKVLLEARRHFRGRRSRPQAIHLLERARRIDPSHFEASFELARVLVRSGQRPRALRLLEALAARSRGRQRRRVRGQLFRLSPTPGAAWRWLRALFGGGGAPLRDSRALSGSAGPPR